jgi:hypothetical protein
MGLARLAINAVRSDNSPPNGPQIGLAKSNATLGTEENEPDNGHSEHSDTYADEKQQEDRGPGFGLTRFHGCFDNDAVLFLHHGCT